MHYSTASRATLRSSPGGRWIVRGLLLVTGLFIAVATLTPIPGNTSSTLCLFNCGPRATADAVANILLFLPFGFALALAGMRPRRALLLAAAISLCIETTQLTLLTGRDANLADVLANASGAFLGALLATHLGAILNPARGRLRPLMVSAALVMLGTVAVTGFLLAPWVPGGEYHGQWNRYRGQYHAYPGEVISVRVGEVTVPRAGVASPRLRESLLAGDALTISARAGRVQAWPTQIARIAQGEGEILLVSTAGEDLVLHSRSRSSTVRLDQPVVRLAGVLGQMEQGAAFTIEITRAPTGYCLRALDRLECPERPPGSWWQLIQTAPGYPDGVRSAANGLALLLLWLPIGMWTRRDRFSVAVLTVSAAALALLPHLVGLQRMSLADWIAAAAGVLLGAGAGWWARRRGLRAGDPRPVLNLATQQPPGSPRRQADRSAPHSADSRLR